MVIRTVYFDKHARLIVAVFDTQTLLHELQEEIDKPLSIDQQHADILLGRLESIQDQVLNAVDYLAHLRRTYASRN